MTGEVRVVRAALPIGAVVAGLSTMVAGVIADARAAAAVAIAATLIFANAALAAGISAASARLTAAGPALMALPSFVLRMGLVLSALNALKGRPFIDETVFAAAFAGMLLVTLFLEARAFKRTPWLALTYGPKERT